MTPMEPAPAPAPAPDRLRAFTGRTIDGRYTLKEMIGEGGFGGVFLSQQRILGRPVRRVAFKLSHRTGMTEETVGELFADILMLARAMDGMTDAAARRHLVHVYDAGLAKDADARAFLVMEYVPGSTLAEQFRALPRVPARQMLAWAKQLGTALHGLHTMAEPLLHRDLKPDNVLLGNDLTVRLIDFGLAARLLTAGHVPGVAGTLLYMAPETSMGESVPASDLYSLGLLMYEGLTGQHPFRDLTPPDDVPDSVHRDWLRRKKRLITPAPPSTLNNTVTRATDAVIMRCLEFEPGRRFRGADEFLVALEGLTGDLPPAAPAAPGEDALAESARLAGQGDPVGAREILEQQLASTRLTPQARLATLRRLAEVLAEQDQPAEAASHLATAWGLVPGSTLLPTRQERRELLAQTEAMYRRAGNQYQADRFSRLYHGQSGSGGG